MGSREDVLARDADEVTVRLADCIKFMGEELVHVNPRPDHLRRVVFDVLMNDPLDELALVQSRIVLAVGLAVGSAAFEQLLLRAAQGHAAAVVIKGRGAPVEHLRDHADRHDVALLVAHDSADWTQVVALARAAVAGAAVDSVSGARLGDLYAVANAAASITNGAASIVDPLGRVLGYSTLPGQPIDEMRRVTTLALQESEPPASDGDFKVAYSAKGAVVIASVDGGLDRLALAVRAGGELLGSIWVIDPGVSKRAAALKALDRMAPLIGLHMLHARSESDFGERRNGDLLRTLMQDPDHASFAAVKLGLEFASGLAVAAFSIVRPESGTLESVRDLQRLSHLVTAVCDVHFTSSHSAVIDSVVFALIPCEGSAPRTLHRRVIQEIGTSAQTISGLPFIGAVGGIAHRIEDLSESRSQALQVLHHLLHRQAAIPRTQGGLVHAEALFEDFRIPLTLLQIGQFIEDNGLDAGDQISDIQKYDAEHRTEYLNALRVYLAVNGSMSAMAAFLHIHNNTARYRRGRLVELFDLDLEDPQLRLWLSLRLETLGLTKMDGR